jgi:osmotically-inducible protein OsmY
MHTDRQLQLDIQAALASQPGIDVAHVGVAVNKGAVTMEGVVTSVIEKSAAGAAARDVDGVRAVANDLEVGAGLATRRSDPALAEAVVNALSWHSALLVDAIQATVTEGRVGLTGEVTWDFQRTAAERAVRQLHGVKSVTNDIIVKSQASVEDVKSRIQRAFRLTGEIDSLNVRVEIRDGAVILTGTVRSQSERTEAERAVWTSPGVRRLDARLLVAP